MERVMTAGHSPLKFKILALRALIFGLFSVGFLGHLPAGAEAQGPQIRLEPDATLYGEAPYANLSVRALADLNADGRTDALIQYSVKARGLQQGQQDIMFGREAWPVESEPSELERVESLGIPFVNNDVGSRDNAPFYGFRSFLDADGDGVLDMATFEQQRRTSNIISEEVKVYLGGTNWKTPDISRAAPDFTILQSSVPQNPYEAENKPMAEQVVAGDFDGDGDQDLGIYTCHVQRGREFDEGQQGTLRLYLSPEGGPRNINLAGGQSDVKLVGEAGPALGCFKTWAGDFDGDGRDDLLISASQLAETGGTWAALLLGRDEWPRQANIAELADVRFGNAVELGGVQVLDARDFDGDGILDAVLDYGADVLLRGACVWPGGPMLPAQADMADCPIRFVDEIYDESADLDGDGFLDLIFDLRLRPEDQGILQFAVLRGPIRGPQVAIGREAGSTLGDVLLQTPFDQGRPLWHVGDLGGDGIDDIILLRESSPNPAGDEFAGRIEILYGPIIDPALLPPTPTVTPTAAPASATPPPSSTPDGPEATPTGEQATGKAIYLPVGLRGVELGDS
jgi:hypothetical protein